MDDLRDIHEHPALRVLLTDQDRPVKLLLERPLAANSTLVVEVHAATDGPALEPPGYDASRLDFDVPHIGRIESGERRQSNGEASHLLVVRRRSDLTFSAPADDNQDPTLHFLTKPLDAASVRQIAREAKEQLRANRRRLAGVDDRHPILGNSEAMRDILDLVERVAAGSSSVLIQGETGTGKTLIARRIHGLSPRAAQRFVAINCSAFQDQLLESELFGHERGAFTGADAAKKGLFETADGGTLFLDEVGDMSAAMQAKLLHVLDDGEIRRVGGNRSHQVDVRIVSASNKDLRKETKAGRFREDLQFRLNVIQLTVPPLAERRDDIPTLAEHFLDLYRLPGRPHKQFTPEATQILMSYSWPGNVRELSNTVEGLSLLARGQEITVDDLPPQLRPRTSFESQGAGAPLPMREIERLHVQRTLRFTDGKKAQAARILGIDVKTLNSKIKKYEIDVSAL